jgi:hypothetical protein
MSVIAHWPLTIYVCEKCGKPDQEHGDVCVCDGSKRLHPVEVAPATTQGAVEALRKLAEIHHCTLTPSKLHDPHNRDWTECECKSCRLAQSFGGR